MTRTALVRLLTATVAAATIACATNPATGKREFSLMSEAQEIAIGQENDVSIRQEMGIYNDDALQQFVASVGLRLAKVSERPSLPWHFTVVDVPVVNAFALPGGTVVLFDGLVDLAQDDDQILGVLGHELGHVRARHSTRQLLQALGVGAVAGLLWGDFSTVAANVPIVLGVMRYGRAFEDEADAFALAFMRANRLPPQALELRHSRRDALLGQQHAQNLLPSRRAEQALDRDLARACQHAQADLLDVGHGFADERVPIGEQACLDLLAREARTHAKPRAGPQASEISAWNTRHKTRHGDRHYVPKAARSSTDPNGFSLERH